MTWRDLTRRLALLVPVVLLLGGRIAGQAEQIAPSVDTPVRGTVDIDGRALPYAYHFDHNALADAVRLGDALIALTRSGNLLRLDADTLTLTARAVVPERATAIARDDRGVVLAGMEDGQIAGVDPATLERTLVVRAGGAVRWLTRENDRLVAVLGQRFVAPRPGEAQGAYDRRSRSTPWSVVVSRRGRITRHTLPRLFEPNAFFLDGATLWLGMDNGEFGGEVRSLDLTNGRVTTRSFESGVLGLLRTNDGRMLAYGGMVHFFSTRGFIADVAGRQSRPVFDREELSVPSETPNETSSAATYPTVPIDRIVEDRAGGGFWVLAGHAIYRANADFSTWTKLHDLGGRFEGGRRASIGNTPTVTSILPGSGPGELLAISTRDGIHRVSPDHAQHLFVRGQLEEPILDVWPTSIGILFLPDTLRSDRIWRLADGGWSAVRMCPDEIAGAGTGEATPVADDGLGVLAYCETGVTPGTSALVRHGTDGRLRTVDTWIKDGWQSPNVLLRGSGGRLFGLARYGDGALGLREDGAWRGVGTASSVRDLSRLPGPESRAYVALATLRDDALIVLRTTDGAVLRLSPRADGTWRLERVSPDLTEVMDAVPDRDDSILGVTPDGLFRFSARTGRVERLRPPGRDTVLTVARDDTGRLWAAGDRLYVSSDEALTWRVVHLPMVSRTAVKRLRPHPSAPGGMFLSLHDRGLVVIGEEAAR